MESNLFVEDINIIKSKSTFSTYKNESIKYEGKQTKIRMDNLMIVLQSRPNLLNALGYQILNTINTLNFCTSRQITEYLNYIININVTQNEVSKKLQDYNKLSLLTRYSFVLDNSSDESGMKFYGLDNSGKILLKSNGFTCNWQHTDALENIYAKFYLIRNQYMIKLYKDCNIKSINYFNLKKYNSGLGAIYSVNSIGHILIPLRDLPDYYEKLIKTFEDLNYNNEYLQLSKPKIIIIGEDATHIFKIFKFLSKNNLMKNNIYFTTDLKLFDRELNKVFVRFAVTNNNGTLNVTMVDEFLPELS